MSFISFNDLCTITICNRLRQWTMCRVASLNLNTVHGFSLNSLRIYIIRNLLMSEKWESLIRLGFSAFFLCCAIYTHYYLEKLQQKLFVATLNKHSQESQLKSTSQWLIKENAVLRKRSLDPVVESQPDFINWLNENDWHAKISNSKDRVLAFEGFRHSWKLNTLTALRLMVLGEKAFLRGDYAACAEITGNLLKREAHAKELLKGNLPAYVSNEYNVYKTRQLFDKTTYLMLMEAVEYGASNYRQAFRGILYLRLFRCYSELSDYSRSRRSLELALEELGWEVVQKFMEGSSRKVLRGLYPRPYWPFVENLSYFLPFDTNLLYGIMSVESGFDPTKVSSAGACGLMQVMPVTAQSLSSKLSRSQLEGYGLDFESSMAQDNLFNCEKLKDVQLNIHLASIFLGQLQFRYKKAHFVIASYNAGETIVRKWVKRSQQKNKSFLTQVQFAETYRYIYKVLNDWLKYRSVYNGDGFTAQNVRYVN